MKVISACIIAFSTYSKIPMPKVEWSEENRAYVICFFPLVGMVIGMLSVLWYALSSRLGVSKLVESCIMAVLPILVSGGIHVDGFMDTMDALHSYQDREEKLRILKDPHIGAFSVISLLVCYLLYLSAVYEIDRISLILVYALGFVLSRILSGIGIVYFKGAKKEGMLYAFSSCIHKKRVRLVLFLELFCCMAGMFLIKPLTACVVFMGNLLLLFYYKHKAEKEFGGITGDLAGWFLQLSELLSALLIAMCCVW